MLHTDYMKLAIQLAENVKGQTTPNPPVGAVVVNDGAIVGFGAHLKNGEGHAEVIALEMAGEKACGATIYVTLEPCSHYGKTAPCADLIIEKELSRVFISCIDQHANVAGSGIKKLTDVGIDVQIGLLQEDAAPLYDMFFHNVEENMPYVTVKSAVSLDGKTATTTGESKWITNEAARENVHYYRHQHDAILVGVQTVLADNPRLTTRLDGGRNPVRIILDTDLRTPIDSTIVTDEQAETWIFTGSDVAATRVEKFSNNQSVRIFTLDRQEVDVKEVLAILFAEEITSVFVEGGATINDAFLRANVINQFILYIAPLVIGGQDAKTSFAGKGVKKLADALQLKIKQVDMIDDNIKVVAVRKDG